jgi:lysophospholipase L1-like esterase
MMRLSVLLLLPAVLSLPLSPAARGADNQPPSGFQPLFNGKDLSGWKGLVGDPVKRAHLSPHELQEAQAEADRQMRDHWKVEDGALVYDGHGNSLCTAKDYGDFELLVDWKIHKDGDSGIYLRGSPQVQIWDRAEGSGGLYNNQKHPANPLVKSDFPPGQWNSFRIKMVGERVTVHLNNVLVVDNTVMENYWERGKPIYPTGQIELQHHGSTLYFKNIYIRELPRQSEVSYPARPGLKRGARIAVAGDSITEQKLYSRFMEDYLLACASELELRVIQLGWGGERAPGFAERMENDLLPFHPDVVTTCYGMNDGSYRKFEPSIGETYRRSMTDIVRRLKAAGALVIVGSPGAVDTFTYRNKGVSAQDYNDNLAHLRDLAKGVAQEEGMVFANVHDPLVKAMEKAKAAHGEKFDVCGGDGVHPNQNGHLVMAYAFLKALGFDGNIGLITVDLKGKTTASEGHQVLSSAGGRVEIESHRYPFCFYGDEKSPASPRSILPFVPFQEELNRLVLVVKNLPSARGKVSWGQASKSFSREELEGGINLAAEFPMNPFSGAFEKVDEAVAKKQNFETPLIKEVITRLRSAHQLLGDDAEGKAALEKLRARLLAKDDELAAKARSAVVPVRHSIVVSAE